MKPYPYSLGAGLIVGVVYSLMGVRSPASPAIALIGLLGILLGEQIAPLARHVTQSTAVHYLRTACREHVFGRLPGDRGHTTQNDTKPS